MPSCSFSQTLSDTSGEPQQSLMIAGRIVLQCRHIWQLVPRTLLADVARDCNCSCSVLVSICHGCQKACRLGADSEVPVRVEPVSLDKLNLASLRLQRDGGGEVVSMLSSAGHLTWKEEGGAIMNEEIIMPPMCLEESIPPLSMASCDRPVSFHLCFSFLFV